MTKSIHGWDVIPAYGHKMLKLFPVPGTKRQMLLRKDVGPYLVAFAAEYHKKIAPIDTGTFDDWAYHPPRKGRASSAISDHSAGVAIDLNATREGAQNVANKKWWARPITALRLRALRKKYHLLEWGGDYRTFYDPMHWTFKHGVTARQVLAEMRRLGIE